MTDPVVHNRIDRRRERTRNTLLAAARKFLAEGRSAVSIQEITDEADVGFGSFYNHFESKEQLFDEAVRSALQVYSELRDSIVALYDDPAEIFAVSFRMTDRLQRQAPELEHHDVSAAAPGHRLRARDVSSRSLADHLSQPRQLP
ncbi:helix-turn-helix domain-containing protein [Nocardia tengchongensis]|uniref:TetR/AcrR family transcriptional regulator n=1 Tax=Nocardia tengchongensis TaxID=2055889 RepID=UPI0033CE2753